MKAFIFRTGRIGLLIIFLAGCKSKKQFADDTPLKGTIHISVDESYAPVIKEMVNMYQSLYPDAHILASYKPEADCIRDFFNDSLNRLVVIGRGLSNKEERFMSDSLQYNPSWDLVAFDAIAIIVHANSTDTLFDKQRLKAQLTGKIRNGQIIVFDGLRATSTVRYINDSILKGEKFDTSVVSAARNSREVIDYVANHENAIGLVGISWIGNPEEPEQRQLLKKVKIAYVRCDQCEGQPFVKPLQASLFSGRYPLVRGLYYVVKENYQGLGTGFVSFLKYEQGQLIFKRAYLRPVMDFRIRNVKINQSLESN